MQRLHDLGEGAWSIVGGNIRPGMDATIEALIDQECAYTVETISPKGDHVYEEIRSIRAVIPYAKDLATLIDIGATPSTLIISFTVTEAGYYLDAENRLDDRHEDLRSDLEGRTQLTIYGAMSAILSERMARNGPPVTLLNCDNLRGNGARFRAGLLDFLARKKQSELLLWVRENATCPNAMVDRITPRPSADVAARVLKACGRVDGAAVMAETYIQWVIEDEFCSARPPWEKVGAEIVKSVAPYEEAKIRILNASHSCIAWAGTLIGLNFIHQGVEVPAIRQMAYAYVTDDVIPCLSSPLHKSPVNLAVYRDVILDRFSNPYLNDTNQRVAMDGFSKVPGFIAPTIAERLGQGESIEKTAVLPALFFRFLERWHRGALPYRYEDQAMDENAVHSFFRSSDPVAAFCQNPALWRSLAGNPKLKSAIDRALPAVRTLEASHG